MSMIVAAQKASNRLILDCRPEPLELDLAQTALLVVDMQNAYASPGGYLDLAGFDLSGANRAIEHCRYAIAAARQRKVQVVYLQNGWDARYLEAGGPGSPNWHKSNALKLMRKRQELRGTLLAKGGWDYELIDSLRPQVDDLIITKTRYSGFYNSTLDSALRSRGIRYLIFCGIATNVCVESTLRDGFFLEYFCVLLDDATHQAGPDFVRQASIFNVETFFGWVCGADNFCRTLKIA